MIEILSEKKEISYNHLENLLKINKKVDSQLSRFKQLDEVKNYRSNHPFRIDFNHLKMINDTKIKLLTRRKKILKNEILKTEKTHKFEIENIQIEDKGNKQILVPFRDVKMVKPFVPETIKPKKIDSEFLKINRVSLIRKKRHLTLIYLDVVNSMGEDSQPRATGIKIQISNLPSS